MEKRTCGKSIASLVLGICGWCIPILGFICDILAIIFGVQARKLIKSNENLKGEGMAIAGIVLGIVGLAICAIITMAILGIGLFVREAMYY